MDESEASQTVLLMATMFACTSVVLMQMGSLGWGLVTLAFTVVLMSMDVAIASDGVCRRFWNRWGEFVQ